MCTCSLRVDGNVVQALILQGTDSLVTKLFKNRLFQVIKVKGFRITKVLTMLDLSKISTLNPFPTGAYVCVKLME